MSYILEALKKAQAERQLGNAPTIHAPQTAQADQPGAAASRKPLLLGLGAGALVVALGALFMWQRGPAPAVTGSNAARPAVTGPAVTGSTAAGPALAGPAAVPAKPPASGRELAVVAPPASAAAGAAPNTLEVSAPPAPAPRPARAAEASAAPQRAPAPAAAAPSKASRPAAAPAPAPEDSLPYLSQLPETVQREVPRVNFGGYMYSANPADRLLLVDKTLRHEGEEVGPGLVLEKLLPKTAVMNYRGTRYRVPY